MRYDSGHKERTRKRLLEVAARDIRATGPEKVGVDSLMGSLGLTRGGFYAHFGSKDDLVAQAIDEMFDQAYSVFRKRTERLGPADALAEYVDFYLSASHCEHPEMGCPLPAVSVDVSRLGARARERFEAGAKRLFQAVAGLFQQLEHDNEKSLELATSLLAEMCGAVAMARAAASPTFARQLRNRSRAAIKTRFNLPLAP
jgi:TetR/AcrR family transcriptional repressor of nem operon